VNSILAEVSAHIRERKRVFRDNDIDSVASFRAIRGQLDGGPYPDIFLLVDRWYEFSHSRPDFVKAIRVIADAGLDHGVHLILTARRWQDVTQDLEEPHDEVTVRRRVSRATPPDSPGWAIHRGRRFRVALPALRTARAFPRKPMTTSPTEPN
jgi:S-DNA-T family DNA segregation ATPase FtsK/SpoIIIE